MTATTSVPLLLLLCAAGVIGQAFECPENTNGQFPDNDNCRVFHTCSNGIKYTQRCAGGSFYDGQKHECVDRHIKGGVKCGPQPVTEAPVTTVDPWVAEPCNTNACRLPDCFCSPDGTRIPGGLKAVDIPQMILITFDGAVNGQNFAQYQSVLQNPNFTNPNGCPIKATFFLSHDYADYQSIEELYSQGHEMAVGSVSRQSGLEDADQDTWVGEMVSMREILGYFSNIAVEDILGQRAPHLKPGRNAQYEVLSDYGFYYDSSVNVPPQTKPVWPYTLDYQIPHECRSGTCPTRNFPNIWEFPMNSHYKNTDYEGGFCPYIDQCVLTHLSAVEIFNWLKSDFQRHYRNNKAPYQLAMSSNWFNTEEYRYGLELFMDYTMTLTDVYYVSMTQAIQWMQDPQAIAATQGFEPWKCDATTLPQLRCTQPESCKLGASPDLQGFSGGNTRYMKTCSACPSSFPWMYDAQGLNRSPDLYQKTFESRVVSGGVPAGGVDPSNPNSVI